MPAGWQRLNEKKLQPNPNIVFIKPLKGPNEKIAQDFLERIAAQCRPIMRENYLYVTALEEYEPNREFVGRNFNAGEVIQLVLKSPSTGRWLPFNYVQMVMMHELAHCKQMNHSRAFWAVRNSYAAEMQGLWSKGYTGDGVWGRGASLSTGAWETNTVLADEALPEHLCGGTYRSRRRKRKAKSQLSYQERKERRIVKKFGKNGQALGADEETKVKLENGRKPQGKPRVAGSMRGRELRAAAALARFEKQKEEPELVKNDDETESGSESEYEDEVDVDLKDAVDVDGKKLVDSEGLGMVKVCEDEDDSDPSARNEHRELEDMIRMVKREARAGVSDIQRVKSRQTLANVSIPEMSNVVIKPEPNDSALDLGPSVIPAQKSRDIVPSKPAPNHDQNSSPNPTPTRATNSQDSTTSPDNIICFMCSFANPELVLTCRMCANILDPSTPGSWQCRSGSCKETLYRNAADCGVCGLCGQRRRDGAGLSGFGN